MPLLAPSFKTLRIDEKRLRRVPSRSWPRGGWTPRSVSASGISKRRASGSRRRVFDAASHTRSASEEPHYSRHRVGALAGPRDRRRARSAVGSRGCASGLEDDAAQSRARLTTQPAPLAFGMHHQLRPLAPPSGRPTRPIPLRKERRAMSKHPHILDAASNLLGIALIIVTGLHVAGRNRQSLADEMACWRPCCSG